MGSSEKFVGDWQSECGGKLAGQTPTGKARRVALSDA